MSIEYVEIFFNWWLQVWNLIFFVGPMKTSVGFSDIVYWVQGQCLLGSTATSVGFNKVQGQRLLVSKASSVGFNNNIYRVQRKGRSGSTTTTSVGFNDSEVCCVHRQRLLGSTTASVGFNNNDKICSTITSTYFGFKDNNSGVIW